MIKHIRWPALVAISGSFLGICLLIFVAVAVGSEVRPSSGGTYIEGVSGQPISINPLFCHFNDVDKDLVALIFSGLTKLNENGEVIPDLAESWEISPDGREYTFHLRNGVQWHDGWPFTADDVLFTVEAIRDPDFPGVPDFALLWKGVSAKKVDDYTVTFTLESAYAPFLAYTTLGILPSHSLGNTPIKELADSPFNVSPVGTGPFKLKEATVKGVLLESNQDYFLTKPYLSNIEFKFYPDYQTGLSALRRKEIHGQLLYPVVNREELTELRKNKDVIIYTASRASYAVIYLNTNVLLFQDKAVRQALLYYLDRKKIITDPLAGQGLIANSPIVSATWAYDSQVKKYDYDPDKANSLLEGAGWRRGDSGIWEKGGVQFRFSLLTNNDAARVAVAEEVVRQLRKAGIAAELSTSGSSSLLQRFLLPRNYEAILYGWDTGYDPDGYPAWHSSQIGEDGFNLAGFSNGRADELLEKGRQATDEAERVRLYGEFQTLFAEEVPSLLLYYPIYTYAIDEVVNGVRLGVLFEPSSRFSNVTEWYMKTKRVWFKGG